MGSRASRRSGCSTTCSGVSTPKPATSSSYPLESTTIGCSKITASCSRAVPRQGSGVAEVYSLRRPAPCSETSSRFGEAAASVSAPPPSASERRSRRVIMRDRVSRVRARGQDRRGQGPGPATHAGHKRFCTVRRSPTRPLALTEAPERTLPEDGLILRARSLAQGDEPLDYEAAIRTLVMWQLVEAGRGGYRPAPGAEKILVYYANSAYH